MEWAAGLTAAGQFAAHSGRRSILVTLLPIAAGQSGNTAQGSISAAFFAQGKARAAQGQGKGMEWRRSILLPIAAGQLCFCRRPFFAQGKGMDWQGQQDRTAGRRR